MTVHRKGNPNWYKGMPSANPYGRNGAPKPKRKGNNPYGRNGKPDFFSHVANGAREFLSSPFSK